MAPRAIDRACQDGHALGTDPGSFGVHVLHEEQDLRGEAGGRLGRLHPDELAEPRSLEQAELGPLHGELHVAPSPDRELQADDVTVEGGAPIQVGRVEDDVVDPPLV